MLGKVRRIGRGPAGGVGANGRGGVGVKGGRGAEPGMRGSNMKPCWKAVSAIVGPCPSSSSLIHPS
eukprot:2108638-Rhodomonas_salina.1